MVFKQQQPAIVVIKPTLPTTLKDAASTLSEPNKLSQDVISNSQQHYHHVVIGREQADEMTPAIKIIGYNMPATYKCSAVHTLERDMPTFDYTNLVHELRAKILEWCHENPGTYSHKDLIKCQNDDWFLRRFLLRQKLDAQSAFQMLKGALRFRHESLSNCIQRSDFPAEFYLLGGLFQYQPDRKGNQTLYVRVKVHKKVPEVGAILQAFIFSNLLQTDELANGRGFAIVLDCTGGGLANADMDTLLFLVSSLLNCFPKGLSYLLVHELPWILKPFWHIAKAWISEEHRQIIKFSDSRTIFEYIDKENLPDFLGGTCVRDYRAVPENCTTLQQAAKLWGIDHDIVKKILLRFAEHLPASSLAMLQDADDDSGNDDCPETDHSDRENKSSTSLD